MSIGTDPISANPLSVGEDEISFQALPKIVVENKSNQPIFIGVIGLNGFHDFLFIRVGGRTNPLPLFLVTGYTKGLAKSGYVKIRPEITVRS